MFFRRYICYGVGFTLIQLGLGRFSTFPSAAIQIVGYLHLRHRNIPSIVVRTAGQGFRYCHLSRTSIIRIPLNFSISIRFQNINFTIGCCFGRFELTIWQVRSVQGASGSVEDRANKICLSIWHYHPERNRSKTLTINLNRTIQMLIRVGAIVFGNFIRNQINACNVIWCDFNCCTLVKLILRNFLVILENCFPNIGISVNKTFFLAIDQFQCSLRIAHNIFIRRENIFFALPVRLFLKLQIGQTVRFCSPILHVIQFRIQTWCFQIVNNCLGIGYSDRPAFLVARTLPVLIDVRNNCFTSTYTCYSCLARVLVGYCGNARIFG